VEACLSSGRFHRCFIQIDSVLAMLRLVKLCHGLSLNVTRRLSVEETAVSPAVHLGEFDARRAQCRVSVWLGALSLLVDHIVGVVTHLVATVKR